MTFTVIERLDLDALPRRALSRLALPLIDNGLAQPMHLPLLVARGRKSGPVFGLTAALHGDELNGIPVIHRLIHSLDLASLRGTVVGAPVLNLPGFLMRQRRFNDGRDLNHLFPGEPTGNASSVYAHRLLTRCVRHMDLLVDLHTASFGRVNCLYIRADMTIPQTARMAYLQGPEVIVHNPPQDGTLRGAAQALGIPSITVEIGNPNRFHREYIRHSVAGLRAVLSGIGMIPRRSHARPPPPVLCARSTWQYTDQGGLLVVRPKVTDRVQAGEEIAHLSTIYGDRITTYHAASDAVVIGHEVNPVAQTGSRIAHLGEPAELGDPRFCSPEGL